MTDLYYSTRDLLELDHMSILYAIIGRAKRPVSCLCLDFVGEVASEKRIVPQCVGELIQVGWSQ